MNAHQRVNAALLRFEDHSVNLNLLTEVNNRLLATPLYYKQFEQVITTLEVLKGGMHTFEGHFDIPVVLAFDRDTGDWHAQTDGENWDMNPDDYKGEGFVVEDDTIIVILCTIGVYLESSAHPDLADYIDEK